MPLRTSASSAVYLDLARVRREASIAGVEFHAELESTNSRAMTLAGQANLAMPLLVLAERQTTGRGRGNNVWWSAPGSLTFSLLFDARAIGLPIDRWPQVSLAAALAIRQTIADLLPEEIVQVKWPNDVFLNGRKVSGILVEIPPVRPEKLVVGIGVNVNNSFADAPAELRSKATSMVDAGKPATGGVTSISNDYDLTEVLNRLVKSVFEELNVLRHNSPSLSTRWHPHCVLQGRVVEVVSGPMTHFGLCQGVDETGALVLQTEIGPNRLLSGVVTSIGPR